MPRVPVRVVVVHGHAGDRFRVARALARDPDLEIAGRAGDVFSAREILSSRQPDVLVLGPDLPQIDGLAFLRLVMEYHPLPVIVLSAEADRDPARRAEFLEAGAVDTFSEPEGNLTPWGLALAARVKNAARPPADPDPATASPPTVAVIPTAPLESPSPPPVGAPARLLLLGASTGGTEALKTVLTQLPPEAPGVCVVQHIPPQFSAPFARRLNELCQLRVYEAQPGDFVEPGTVLVAPGGKHLTLQRAGETLVVQIEETPPVNYQRPSVDVLFDSACQLGFAPEIVAVLLTGMGNDGAAGLLRLRQAGATTLVQDEASCAVFGMPREAIRLGAAQHILPPAHLGAFLARYVAAR